MNKKVLFVYEKKLSELPPLITLMEALKLKGYSISLIVSQSENLYEDNSTNFIECEAKFKFNNKLTRAYNRLFWGKYFFRFKVPKIIKKENYDLVWVIVASNSDSLFYLNRKFNSGLNYLCSIFELYDTFPKILKRIEPLAQNASKVIVPEYNRANITRVWFNLKDTPYVLPNIPISLPKLSDIKVKEKLIAFEGKKIILYQGHIQRGRSMEAICKAVDKLEGFVFVLMGKSHEGYAEELVERYKSTHHIGFFRPPFHLQFTSKAYIGIVSYGFSSLNGIFCAPNKIWEYSGYAIPMICNDIPGLFYTVGQSKSGICLDMENEVAIINGIKNIDNNYNKFSCASKEFYESYNVLKIVDTIIS